MPGNRSQAPQPLLKTPQDQINKVEKFKLESDYAVGVLPEETRDLSFDEIGEAAEQLAKSHGIYLEYNRAKTGKEKDWMYMVRLTVPGGGAFNAAQWAVVDDIADKYCDHNPHGTPSIRLTTRQNIQYHWVKKPDIIKLVQEIAQTGFYTMNGCGDNVRNVMGCPLSKYSDVFNGHEIASQLGAYFRLPASSHIQVFAVDPNFIRDPEQQYRYGRQLLNRKFKIAVGAVQRDPRSGELVNDNCVEMRTNEVGIAPVINEAGNGVEAFQVYIGGGQGEKNGKSSMAVLGQPLGVFTRDHLLAGMDAIVKVHEEWGDRKNRHWARLKYVVREQGIGWYQERIAEKGAEFTMPIPGFDIGPRMMHHGWTRLPSGKYAYGAYIECGRLVDTHEGDDPEHRSGNVTGNGRLKAMVRGVMDHFTQQGMDDLEVMVTANQDLLFGNIDADAREDFEAKLAEHGYGSRKGKAYSTLRVLSGACVGLPTCRLSYTDSEQFEPELIDQLEDMGYGDVAESIGITGCERQCFRPGTKTIGWVGQGPNMYGLKLGGGEDGRHQGQWLVGPAPEVEADAEPESVWYCRQVGREDVPNVCAVLFDWYAQAREAGKADADEDDPSGAAAGLGGFLRKQGAEAIIDRLKTDERTAHVMEKTAPAPFMGDGGLYAATA